MSAIAVERKKGMSTSRHYWRLALLIVVSAGLLWGIWRWWALMQYQRAIAEIQQDIQAGKHGHARLKLTAVSAWWSSNPDQVAYLAGICERAKGRPDLAAESWARVSSTSSFTVPAILRRAEILLERGQLSESEQLIKSSLEDPRIDGSGLRLSLVPTYCHLGRVDDAERLIEASWNQLKQSGAGGSEDAVKLLRLHIALWLEPPAVEATRAFLDQAGRSAPEDDLVWLGKANLAIKTGSYDEASRWLEACLGRRPDDVAVWRASLHWAMATDRVTAARKALDHLPACEMPSSRFRGLTAWLAAQTARTNDDVRELMLVKELRALLLVTALDPADFAALDRLIERAVEEGRADRAAELRGKKAEIEHLRARYQELYKRNQPYRDAVEMGRLAEQLGRRFEAKVFLTIALAVDPKRDDLRTDLDTLDKYREAIGESAAPVAELLGPDLTRANPASRERH
jgi:enediyne biosynthesis protein E4